MGEKGGEFFLKMVGFSGIFIDIILDGNLK